MQQPIPRQFPLRDSLASAARFWEPRRVIYNLLLGAVVGLWVMGTWPHFRPAFTAASLGAMAVLALLANVCYCAAYFVDIPMQQAARSALWKRLRWTLWIVGMLFALVLENYWIGDEIYPDVNGTQSALAGYGKMEFGQPLRPPELKPGLISDALSGAKAPLFHGYADTVIETRLSSYGYTDIFALFCSLQGDERHVDIAYRQ